MSNLKWEQSETDEEDIENYGEGVERWELIDYSTGSIVSIFFGRHCESVINSEIEDE